MLNSNFYQGNISKRSTQYFNNESHMYVKVVNLALEEDQLGKTNQSPHCIWEISV